MALLNEHIPVIIVMLFAALISAFCSASEAAFFSLSQSDRKRFKSGGRLQRLAATISDQSSKILPAILLWNLLANLSIFACSTITSLKLQKAGATSLAGTFALVSLFGVILFCEMLPKSFGVTVPRLLTPLLALPLSLLIRIVRPIIPWFERINLLTQRLFFPNLKPEPHLQVSDLERMIELTPSRGKNASPDNVVASLSLGHAEIEQPVTLLKREQQVLRNIVALSDATAEEMMRPRTHLQLFKPPVTLESLRGQVPSGGYLLITEPDTDEIASAIQLDRFTGTIPSPTPNPHSPSPIFHPVVYVPWRMKASHVLETLQKENNEVAAVVNEYGETIGILTFDDLVYSIFAMIPSRSQRLFNKRPIRHNENGQWVVSTLTTLRRIERHFHVKLPEHEPSTVGGMLEEVLERFPEEGDECVWGPFQWRVLAKNDDGIFDVEIAAIESNGGES